MKCEYCLTRPGTRSAVIHDEYYRDLCDICYSDMQTGQSVSSGQAVYNRGRDHEEHEADIRQPLTDGKPDAEFIRLYPETAKKIFTPEELHRAVRS